MVESKRLDVQQNFSIFQRSFRHGAQTAASTIRREAGEKIQRVRLVPPWIRLFTKIYHSYGLKHVFLISILIGYQFIGAAIFYFCETSFEDLKEARWNDEIQLNRTNFVKFIIPTFFNNSDYLFFLTDEQTFQVQQRLEKELAKYEQQLGIKYTDQKISWDFWNAMLYAQTICTTIGYGHLYPSTTSGRLCTMLYAIFGIPLVLSILNDLGKLLTKCLKTPWYLFKCCCRRIFRYCTKQTLDEIRKLDDEDKRDLEVFDLPIPVAISVVIIWIFVCSATFCIWERDWDYFVAFYFFFISLSTIGLGDITPAQPKYLLMLFIYIIIGLSLVSMCINLIQAKLERTYEAGRNQCDSISLLSNDLLELPRDPQWKRRQSQLGTLKLRRSVSFSREAAQITQLFKKRCNKYAQTILSFPSHARKMTNSPAISNFGLKFLSPTLSIDDVMKLVDTEEGDILILTDLSREDSCASEFSNGSENTLDGQTDISRSFEASTQMSFARHKNFLSLPSHATAITTKKDQNGNPESMYRCKKIPSLNEIEEIEEIEDRLLFGNHSSFRLNFQSRLSLIPETQSIIDEAEEIGEDNNDPNSDSRLLRNSSTSQRERLIIQ